MATTFPGSTGASSPCPNAAIPRPVPASLPFASQSLPARRRGATCAIEARTTRGAETEEASAGDAGRGSRRGKDSRLSAAARRRFRRASAPGTVGEQCVRAGAAGLLGRRRCLGHRAQRRCGGPQGNRRGADSVREHVSRPTTDQRGRAARGARAPRPRAGAPHGIGRRSAVPHRHRRLPAETTPVTSRSAPRIRNGVP